VVTLNHNTAVSGALQILALAGILSAPVIVRADKLRAAEIPGLPDMLDAGEIRRHHTPQTPLHLILWRVGIISLCFTVPSQVSCPPCYQT
jgi:hypothetical protein